MKKILSYLLIVIFTFILLCLHSKAYKFNIAFLKLVYRKKKNVKHLPRADISNPRIII